MVFGLISPRYRGLVNHKMQALLHGGTADQILPSTHVALMGPTDRDDAISGIIMGLGAWCPSGPRHQSRAGFPVPRLHLIRSMKPSLKAPPIQTVEQLQLPPNFQRTVQRPTP